MHLHLPTLGWAQWNLTYIFSTNYYCYSFVRRWLKLGIRQQKKLFSCFNFNALIHLVQHTDVAGTIHHYFFTKELCQDFFSLYLQHCFKKYSGAFFLSWMVYLKSIHRQRKIQTDTLFQIIFWSKMVLTWLRERKKNLWIILEEECIFCLSNFIHRSWILTVR